MKLDKLVQITDLWEIWKNEAQDFTPWLAKDENLELLSEAIGIDITLEEKESSVGTFSVDVFAKEEGTGRNIIIENQLEDTNHDHLGKLITYASGKNAEIVIWIVKRARDEHRQAIEWLNSHTDETAAFFLIEIELWKIGQSQPAPKFNVVERPNDWAKAMRRQENLSPTEAFKLEYWTEFKSYAESEGSLVKEFSLRKPSKEHWYDFATGKSSIYLQLTITTPKNIKYCGITIYDDKELAKTFHDTISELEKRLGVKIKWKPANKSDRLVFECPAHFKERDKWNEDFDWFIKYLLELKKIVYEIAK